MAIGLCFAAAAVLAIGSFGSRKNFKELRAVKHPIVVSIACALAAIVLTTIGGEGRLFSATHDWLVRDAVLHDMVQQNWPFAYRSDGTDWMLRAPVGMYLLPAILGKLAGLRIANLALWLQNTAAIFTVLRILSSSNSVARSITVLVVFCIFSGWDVVGALITRNGLVPPIDIEWWAFDFQYSSTMTLAFWAPNHALAGWLVAALLLLWESRRITIGQLAIGAGLSVCWSPFALIGGLPFLAKAGLEALRERRISWTNVWPSLPVALAMVPLVIFLTSDSGDVPHGFQPLTPSFGVLYGLFITLELLPFLAINLLANADRGGFSRSTYLVAVVSLLLIPFYSMGSANDFAMRASIPALAVVATTTGQAAFLIFKERKAWKIILVCIVLMFGLMTGIVEMLRIFMAPNNGVSTWRSDSGPGIKTPRDQNRNLITWQTSVTFHTLFSIITYRSTKQGRPSARCIDQKL